MTLTDVKIFLKKYAVQICRSSYTQDIPLIFHQTQYRPISFNKSLTLCISDLFISFLHYPFQNLRSSHRKKRMTGSSSSHWSAAGGEQELHVLAVDDSLLDRKLIERLLKSSSYRVTTVESGKRALELLGLGKERSTKKPKVNMIITDYCMPEMTGLDLLKRVKESSSLREIPVVIMSSENVPNRISSCLEEGAEEFILKPLRPSDLSRLHHHMLRINRVSGVS